MRHKRQKERNRTIIRCPYCGSPAILRSAEGIYHDNSHHTMLYVCRNYPECDSYVRVHAGTNIPVGTMANKKLRALRTEAHRYFDRLYQSGLMSKEDAYNWLASVVRAPLSKAHIGYLGEYYCKIVIEESKKQLRLPKNRTMYNSGHRSDLLPYANEHQCRTCSNAED